MHVLDIIWPLEEAQHRVRGIRTVFGVVYGQNSAPIFLVVSFLFSRIAYISKIEYSQFENL